MAFLHSYLTVITFGITVIMHFVYKLGIILVVTIQPGSNQTGQETSERAPRNVTTVDTLMDLVRNMFPPNLVEACIAQHQTKIEMDVNSNFCKIIIYIHVLNGIHHFHFILFIEINTLTQGPVIRWMYLSWISVIFEVINSSNNAT